MVCQWNITLHGERKRGLDEFKIGALESLRLDPLVLN